MAHPPSGPTGPAPQTDFSPRPAEPRPPAGGGRRAVVGAASAMRGQLAAREDVWIEGVFDGEIQAAGHQVTVAAGGRVRAEIKSRSVVVEGELVGDVVAEQMVIVRVGGRMQGDIRSPRVALEEGCQFQGNVDMDGTLANAATDPAADAAAETSTEPAAATVMVAGGGG